MMLMKIFLISILLGWFVCSGLAQPGPSENTTNQLSVALWPPHADLKAPALINIQAYVRLDEPGLKAGDSVNVEFFANSKSISSARAIWHDTIRPHAAPGQAVPMWIMPAGFYPALCTWKKVPAGNYSVTARATWTNGLSAVSAPIPVTITSQ
jgi:hypothetical protein